MERHNRSNFDSADLPHNDSALSGRRTDD